MTDENLYTTEDEIRDVSVVLPHVVILGAGASLAALPSGDRNGRHLPLMVDFIAVLGLKPILEWHGVSVAPNENFESLYSRLHRNTQLQEALDEVEDAIDNYFAALELPDSPTIYDYLVLSLREKDIIATFNWDPFLYNACYRNQHVGKLPHIVYLHGNVAIGYCSKDKRKGVRTAACSVCSEPFMPTRLLYPVEQKDYNTDEFIRGEWSTLEAYLHKAFVLTIFGYSAPTSDVEAIELMKKGWGKPAERSLEQIEIIDVKSEDTLRSTWSPFIHSHHYEVHTTFYNSWLALHPRRSCEAAQRQFIDAKFIDENSFPRVNSFDDLWSWYETLTKFE